jgi:hypothetical protein
VVNDEPEEEFMDPEDGDALSMIYATLKLVLK